MQTSIKYIPVDNSVKIWTETLGYQGGKAVLFISGAGAGSFFWSDEMCTRLAMKGYFVIRYDHRDFGHSDKINFDQNPFDMIDLTRDAISILDAFEVEKAHVVGHSMGGFIAQLIAVHYPERLSSIISASSSTSAADVPLPPDKTWEIFLNNKPTNNLENDLEGFLNVWKYLNGTAVFDEQMAVEYTMLLYNRQKIIGPLGESHVRAQANISDRTKLLSQVNIPALIMHGKEDYLVDPRGGIQTAECMPNSKLVLFPQMGHLVFNRDLQKRFENEIIDFIDTNRS